MDNRLSIIYRFIVTINCYGNYNNVYGLNRTSRDREVIGREGRSYESISIFAGHEQGLNKGQRLVKLHF